MKKVDNLLPVLDLVIKDLTPIVSSSTIRHVSTRKINNMYITIKSNIVLVCIGRVVYISNIFYIKVTIIGNFILVIKCVKTSDELYFQLNCKLIHLLSYLLCLCSL